MKVQFKFIRECLEHLVELRLASRLDIEFRFGEETFLEKYRFLVLCAITVVEC